MIGLLAIIIFPAIKLASSVGNTSTFTVSLTISNSPPNVTWVQAASGSPAEGTTSVVQVQFNATDPNGVQDIPASNAKVIINYSATQRSSSVCYITGTAGVTNTFTCNITMNYYDTPGAWDVNASVFDGANNVSQNLTEHFTFNSMWAIQLKTASLTFSGNPGSNSIAASNDPQYVNNTGNTAFGNINLTAFALQNGANFIGAGNFTANVTSSASGQRLVNNSMVVITNSSLAVQGQRNLYVYVDIPNGATNGSYTSSSSWIVTVTS